MPRQEGIKEAITRLTRVIVKSGREKDNRKARKIAKAHVEHPTYQPKLVDPPPGKSGLVRDLALRRILRDEISRRLSDEGISRDADSFTKSDLNRVLKNGPLRMSSSVPIKRVVLLRTMNDPVVIPCRIFDFSAAREVPNPLPQSARAYVGGNNHHIEIREDSKGRWSGAVVPAFEASRRVRIEHKDAIDRSDCEAKGGRFVMSLAEGETVYMQPKESVAPDYFVVFKLDKPQTIQFKYHWDARRAKGEKSDDGHIIEGSEREAISVSASQLKSLPPAGEMTPIKVLVEPITDGRVLQIRRLEPHTEPKSPIDIDPRVMAIVRDAIVQRQNAGEALCTSTGHKPGSWSWMKARLKCEGVAHLAPQLTSALRQIRGENVNSRIGG
jgi:CRISPR-associated endonuclease Csn1